MEESSLGIDLASQAKKTAACRILWKKDGPVVQPLAMPCSDYDLDELIKISSVVGIDAPFGWPRSFVAGIANWEESEWNDEVRDDLCLRVTDRWVWAEVGKKPLSVSSDLIAIPAMRAQCLLKRFGVIDKSGDGKFYEVYPAGSLKAWNLLPGKSYKKGDESFEHRKTILDGLQKHFTSIPEEYAETDDALDALVAAITARCAQLGLTHHPEAVNQEPASTEGWIHLPVPQSTGAPL